MSSSRSDKQIFRSQMLASTYGCEHPDDKVSPSISDVTVLIVDGAKTVVVTDDANDAVKSLCIKNSQSSITRLLLEDGPWGITKLKDNQVMVAVPKTYQIITVEVNSSDLVRLSTITTCKKYTSLAVLGPSSLAAGSGPPGCVDILNMEGHVIKSVPTCTSGELFLSPLYMCVNHKGSLLVSDRGRKSVTCLTPEGNVTWTRAPKGDNVLRYPVGIASTRKSILLVDRDSKKVIQLTKRGEYVQDVLTLDESDTDPWCVYVDKDKSLFVCCIGQIKHFKYTGT